MESKKEKMLLKIKKLLALGDKGRNASEHEASAALALARKYMDENNLSMSEVDLANDKKSDIIQSYWLKGGNLHVWEKRLARCVCTVCDVDILFGSTYDNQRVISFVGLSRDAETAKLVYIQFHKSISLQAVATFPDNKSAQNDFLWAFCEKLCSIAYEQKQRSKVKYSHSRAIVVLKEDMVKEYIKDKVKPKKGVPTKKKKQHWGATILGLKGAKNFDLGINKKVRG